MRPQAGVDRLKPVPPMHPNDLPLVAQAVSPAYRIVSQLLREGLRHTHLLPGSGNPSLTVGALMGVFPALGFSRLAGIWADPLLPCRAPSAPGHAQGRQWEGEVVPKRIVV